MNEMSAAVDAATGPGPAPARAPLGAWIREGLRAGVLLRPRVGAIAPSIFQVLALLALLSAVDIGLSRLEIPGPATFDLRGWLAPWWGTGAMVLLLWALLHAAAPAAEPARPRGVAAWFALWFMAVVPATLVAQGISIAEAQGWLAIPPAMTAWFGWALYAALWAWTLAMALRLGWHFGLAGKYQLWLAMGLLAIFGLNAWQFPDRPWRPEEGQAEDGRPRLVLSQETLEAQQAAWHASVAALAPHRPGVTEVYGLVFAPYAAEDVFLRESTMVARLLEERFDAKGRLLHLVNHATTAESHPWATPLNLKRAIAALAAKMDTSKDLLVVYLTSHGASNYQLAAMHWPLAVEPISPGDLREALDAAGVKNRVIAVSACYSGGWTGPLGSDTTLVMTAADATKTSYGCGALSELTFFGRAVFDEQLRKTHSFEHAFAAAVPLIMRREQEAGKADGFSNPQISVGEKIRPLLRQLEQRLTAGAQATGHRP
jgi:hypothetical protein